jgi:UAA transporter family
MRRKQERVVPFPDDADIAAGLSGMSGLLPSAPISRGGMSTVTSASDIEFYEDLISEPVLVLGVDISHVSRRGQFLICATGVFFFSLLYGYLQELLSVQLCSRKLGLFLAVVQFSGYTSLAYVLRTYVYRSHGHRRMTPKSGNTTSSSTNLASKLAVPFSLYLGLSLLRAVDLAMTNLAMQYINYPAKTLMKSSRVVFTMLFGVLITHKRYNLMDYFIVVCMVVGLVVFMHADATSSAVFEPIGVIMLVRPSILLLLRGTHGA